MTNNLEVVLKANDVFFETTCLACNYVFERDDPQPALDGWTTTQIATSTERLADVFFIDAERVLRSHSQNKVDL